MCAVYVPVYGIFVITFKWTKASMYCKIPLYIIVFTYRRKIYKVNLGLKKKKQRQRVGKDTLQNANKRLPLAGRTMDGLFSC